MAGRSQRARPIRFGTGGFRGILGEDFTFERARAAVAGLAGWVIRGGGPRRVLVAHDTRFLAERFAESAARVLRARGIEPVLARGPVPTPVAAYAVARRKVAAGLIFTASHNAPEYQGLKLVAPGGGVAGPELTGAVEVLAARALTSGPIPEAEGPLRPVDLRRSYLSALGSRIDGPALRAARLTVFYDALHGTGAGSLDAILERAGVRVEGRRMDPDPRFGGVAPDPVPARLRELGRAVATARGLRIGLATDGDADRFAVLDADGRPLAETEALALLVDHLARTGRLRRGVAISSATGSLVERVAAEHGLPVQRHPMGFAHLSAALASGEADVAGEESGGFAWSPFAPGKDGILAGALLAERVAQDRAPLRARLRELERAHGRSACGRIARARDERGEKALERLRAAPPARFDGVRVLACEREDGLRLALEDGFVMLRASATEPVLRIYAEAPGPRRLTRRLAAAGTLLGKA